MIVEYVQGDFDAFLLRNVLQTDDIPRYAPLAKGYQDPFSDRYQRHMGLSHRIGVCPMDGKRHGNVNLFWQN